MKLLDSNWLDFIARTATWRALQPSSREVLKATRPSDLYAPDVFGEDLERLQRERFLEIVSAGRRARLHPEATAWVRAIRAFLRLPVLREPSGDNLLAYLREHLTNEERALLPGEPGPWGDRTSVTARRVQSKATLDEFLTLEHAARWEADRRESRFPRFAVIDGPWLEQPAALRGAQALVRAAMEAREPIAFSELRALSNAKDAKAFERGLHACLRYVLLLPGLREDDEPVVWIWPPIAARLHRPTPTPAARVEAVRSFDACVLLDDATAFLVALADEPARLKANRRELFARDEERLVAALAEIEAWVAPVAGPELTARKRRMYGAFALALRRRWVAQRGVQSDRAVLDVSDRGRAWLAADSRERELAVIEPMRLDVDLEDEEQRRELEALLGYDAELLELASHRSRKGAAGRPVQDALIAAWRALDGQGFVDFGGWLDHATRARNPLLEHRRDLNASFELGYAFRERTEEELEHFWRAMLIATFERLMWPAGAVELGRAANDRPCLRLSGVGRFVLGVTRELATLAAKPPSAPAIVQPNFEIVFLAPSPATEASLAPFCERRGQRVGALFSITRDACLAAAAAGLNAVQALERLRAASSKPLPDNVVHEIETWFGEARRVELAEIAVLRCPDARTAQRVLAAAGKSVRTLSDTVIELADAGERAKLLRALRKHGLFVDLPQAAEPVRRPKRRRWG